MTNKIFTVNLVDEKCKEVSSDQRVPSMELFSQILTNGQAYRVREVGSDKLFISLSSIPANRLWLSKLI